MALRVDRTDFMLYLYAMYMYKSFDPSILREYVCRDKALPQRVTRIRTLCSSIRKRWYFKTQLIHDIVKYELSDIAQYLVSAVYPSMSRSIIVPGLIIPSAKLDCIENTLKDLSARFVNLYSHKCEYGFKRRKGNEEDWIYVAYIDPIPRPARGFIPINGMGIHNEGYFLIRLKRSRYHILPLAVSKHCIGEHLFLRMATLAIRDWIPVLGMAIKRERGEKSIYMPIEQDIVIPMDFVLWDDGIAEIRIYGSVSPKTRLYLLRFWQALIEHAVGSNVSVHSFAEVLSQEHCIKYLLNILNKQGMITVLNVKLRNANVNVIAYGERKVEFYPSIVRGEVSYDEILKLFNCGDVWQLLFDKGELRFITVRLLANEKDRDRYATLLNELGNAEPKKRESILAMLYSLTRAYTTIYLSTGTLRIHKLQLPSMVVNPVSQAKEAESEVHMLLANMFSYAMRTQVIDLYEEIYADLRNITPITA